MMESKYIVMELTIVRHRILSFIADEILIKPKKRSQTKFRNT